MIARNFKELVAISKLAESEGTNGTSTLALVMHSDGETCEASFEGAHTGALRTSTSVEIDGLTDTPIAVPYKLLNGALSLIEDDDPISVRVKGNELQISSSAIKTAKVRLSSALTPLVAQDLKLPDTQVEIDVTTLPALVGLLNAVSAKTVANPVLTGINISVPTDGQLLLRASDGARAFAALVPAAKAVKPFEVTLQAGDFISAFAIMRERVSITLTAEPVRIILQDANTLVRLSSLFGNYPSFKPLPRKDFAYEFVLPASLLRLAHKASLMVDSNRIVTFACKDGHLTATMAGAETGEFLMDIADTNLKDFEVHFDAEYLVAAADLGVDITIRVKAVTAPAYMTGREGLHYWLSPIIKR